MAGNTKNAARSIRWGLFALVVLLVVGYGATYLQQQKSINGAQARIDELEGTLEAMRLTASALESDLEFSKTDAYIERIAREELGYVLDGEIKFVLGDGIVEPANDSNDADDADDADGVDGDQDGQDPQDDPDQLEGDAEPQDIE